MALAREQITIVDLHDGVDGSTYSLNILGGTRTISYNATGKSPTPAQTAYSCELYKDGVKVTPSSYAWSASGHLSGTSTDAGFTPTAVQTYNASLTSSNVVSLTVAYGGTVFKGTIQVVVTKAATDAKLITLVADSQVFKAVGKTVSPATAKITAETQNTSVTTWTYSANGAAFIGTLPAGVARSGSTVTITGASMTDQTIAVKASDGTYSDVITIVKVADGGRGEPGTPAVQPITGFLTNESVTFPADFNGNVTGHTGPIGTFKVFQGTTDVTTSAAFTASNQVGGAVSISDTGVYTLNSLSADRASVDLKAVYGDVSIVKTLTISKSRAGTPGPEGYTVILTNESHVFPGLESKAVPGSSVTSNVIVYKGPTQIASSAAVTGAPSGMTVTVAGKDSTSNSFTAAIEATKPMTTMNGELTVTVTADGKTFPKKFSFAVAKKGTDGTPAKVVKIIPSALNFVTNTVSSDPASYVYTPSSIALTPTFQSCTYSKWQYSTNGSTWTNITTQNGLSINSTSKVLTVSSSSTLFSTTQTLLIFKCLSSTGEADVVTLNRIFESGALGRRLRTAEINLSEQEGKIALKATQEEVNDIETRLSEAEVKVEPGSIVSTVRGSTEYVDDLGEKVSTDEVISTINQRPGSVTIDASKIDINGAVTFSSFDKNLKDELNSKARTFTSTPVPPYSLGDIWKNSTSTYMCKVARATGSYVAADWEKTGDVTSANKAADTSKVGGTAAATVVTGAAAGSAAKTATDRWTYTGKTTIDGGKIQTDTVTAVQIKAKTITAKEIEANTITVDELASSVGGSLDLSSNKAITSRVTSTQMSTALSGKEDSIFMQASAPAHKVGRLWLDTSTATNQLKRSDGTKWVVVSDVQVGGRNLLKNTGLTDGTSGWSGVSIHNLNGESVFRVAGTMSESADTPLEPNQYYTTTIEIYPTVDIPIGSSTPLHTYYRSSASTNGGTGTRTMLQQGSVAKANEWTRITEVVKTNQSVTTYKFHVYFPAYINSTTPAYVKNIKFEKGNMATDWTPAPEDIEAEMNALAGEIGDVSGALSTLDGHIKTTFKDGVINEAEAKAIEKYLNIINTEKADVDAKYTKLYANTLLGGTAKTGLSSAKSSYNTAHANLISAINTAISDKLVNATEKANVDTKFGSYRTALTSLSTAFETASAYLVNVVNNKIDMDGGILTRLNAAEQAITPTEIRNTVSAIKNSQGKPYFAQTSVVEQTVDTWTAKFSSIGGTNMLTNSSFSENLKNTGATSGVSIVLKDGRNSARINGSFGRTDTVSWSVLGKVEPNEKYTMSGWVKLESIKSGPTNYTIMYYADGNSSGKWYGWGSKQIPANTSLWQYVTHTFTAPSASILNSATSCNVYLYARDFTGTVYFRDLQLERGEVATDWTPHPDELYTGITKIDKDGVTVGRSGSETRTELAHNGLNIYDGLTELASFGDVGAKIKEAQIDKLITTDAVLNYKGGSSGRTDCYVGNGKQYPNVSAVLTDLFYTKGEFRSHIVNDSRIDIYIQTDIQDNIAIYGIHGSGSIYIWFENGATLDGNIDVRDNTCRVYVRQRGGGHPRGKIKDDKSSWATIVNLNSAFLMLIGIDMDVNGNDYGVGGNDGGVTVLQDWDCSGAKIAAARALSGHSVRAFNSKGNAPTGFLAQRGGAVYLAGTTVRGSSKHHNADLGYVVTQGTLTPTDSAFIKPPLKNKTFTYEIPAKSLSTYNYTSGFVSSYYGNKAAQGKYTGMSGWMEGRVVFGTNVASKFSGATSIKTYVKLKRSSPSHGPSAAVKPKSYGFTATWASGAKLGKWTPYAEVPRTLFSTSGDSTLKFRGTALDSDYAIWDNAMVKVVVVKRV